MNKADFIISVETEHELSVDDINEILHDFRMRLQGYTTECPKSLINSVIKVGASSDTKELYEKEYRERI